MFVPISSVLVLWKVLFAETRHGNSVACGLLCFFLFFWCSKFPSGLVRSLSHSSGAHCSGSDEQIVLMECVVRYNAVGAGSERLGGWLIFKQVLEKLWQGVLDGDPGVACSQCASQTDRSLSTVDQVGTFEGVGEGGILCLELPLSKTVLKLFGR